MLKVVKIRSELMSRAFEGKTCKNGTKSARMVLCLADHVKVKDAVLEFSQEIGLKSGLEVTIHNSPRKTFVAGHPDELQIVVSLIISSEIG